MIDLKKIQNKVIKKENLYLFLMILVIFSIDRFSKNMILNNLTEQKYINEFINFNLTWNTGIGFGLFSSSSNLTYLLVTLLIFSIILILIFLAINSDRYDKIVYSIITGGAIGNLFDRITYNAVPDYIDIHYNNFHWFTFNVADIFITIGLIAFIMKNLFIKKKK